MRKLSYLSFIVAIFGLASCTVTEEIVCEPGKLTIMATGFTKADLDSAIVIRHAVGQAFGASTDTAATRVVQAGKDTLQLMVVPYYSARTPAPWPTGYLDAGADYQLYIPRMGVMYYFTEIKLAGNTRQTITRSRRDGKSYSCTNHVVSLAINKALFSVAHKDGFMSSVYISK